MWNPVCKVFINGGTEYTSDTIADVAITYGKKDQTEAFRSSYASFSLISDGAGLPIALNDRVFIYLEDSTATDQLIFTGKISDYSIEMLQQDWITYRITALSPLANLGRYIEGYNGFSEELDGERIESIMAGVGFLSWFDATGTWASQTSTWLGIGSGLGNVDAGTFTLQAYNLEPASVTDLLAVAELSGLGWLYETTDGKLNYDDIKGRYDRQIALGWETIDPDNVILAGTRADISSGFTSTAVEVSNYNNQHTYVGNIITPAATYGKLYQNFETWLKNKLDLPNWLKWYLVRFSDVQPVLSSFAIPLSQLSDAQRDVMIGMINGLPVEITGLPSAISASAYQGYVEGWSWRITTGEAIITLNISPKQYSYWAALAPSDGDFDYSELV